MKTSPFGAKPEPATRTGSGWPIESPGTFNIVRVDGGVGDAPAFTTTAPKPIAAPTPISAAAWKNLRTGSPPDLVARLRVGAIDPRAPGGDQIVRGVFLDS